MLLGGVFPHLEREANKGRRSHAADAKHSRGCRQLCPERPRVLRVGGSRKSRGPGEEMDSRDVRGNDHKIGAAGMEEHQRTKESSSCRALWEWARRTNVVKTSDSLGTEPVAWERLDSAILTGGSAK